MMNHWEQQHGIRRDSTKLCVFCMDATHFMTEKPAAFRHLQRTYSSKIKANAIGISAISSINGKVSLFFTSMATTSPSNTDERTSQLLLDTEVGGN